jgi:membrane protein implicated in regulation of membrane protease activity
MTYPSLSSGNSSLTDGGIAMGNTDLAMGYPAANQFVADAAQTSIGGFGTWTWSLLVFVLLSVVIYMYYHYRNKRLASRSSVS